jgi:hypothetical protein
MQQTNPQGQQRSKKSVLVAGLGAAFVAAGITFAMMSGNPTPTPSPSTAPVQTAAPAQVAAPVQTAPPVAQAAPPQAKSCQREQLVELAWVENGGNGVIRFREGDYLSPPITLTSEPQPIVFPKFRPDAAPLKEEIFIEGQATHLVLGADGDHYVIDRVDGSTSYTMNWAPKKCPTQ